MYAVLIPPWPCMGKEVDSHHWLSQNNASAVDHPHQSKAGTHKAMDSRVTHEGGRWNEDDFEIRDDILFTLPTIFCSHKTWIAIVAGMRYASPCLCGTLVMTSTRIWPVIHVSTPELALRNAEMAARVGAHGVFLIHMEGHDELLDPLGEGIMTRFPGLHVGVNYLSMKAPDALARAVRLGYSASWSDSPGVRSDGVDDGARDMASILTLHPRHHFFASVAFKYQPLDPNPGLAAQRALGLGMIPTTSGVATGSAPDVAKLDGIRQIIGAKAAGVPLAVASGVTPENAAELLPYLSDVLVSTGISESFHVFDETRLRQLMNLSRG
jgi:hypothetical protein